MIKKTILPVLALLAITSCTSDEVLQESPNPSGQPYINFSSLVNNNTRAEMTTELMMAANQTIKVDAIDDMGQFYFGGAKDSNAGELATYSTSTNTFEMDNKYYWPDKQLTFIAWWPSSIVPTYQTSTSNGVSRYTAHNINLTPQQLASKTDVMVAISKANHPYYWSQAQPLTFRHLFAQMIVRAKDDASDYNIEVKEIQLRYMSSSGLYNGGTSMSGTDMTQADINLRLSLGNQLTQNKKANSDFFNSSSFSKDCDKWTGSPSESQMVCSFTESKENGITLNNNFTTLVGEENTASSSEGSSFVELKNGFFMLDQQFQTSTDQYSPYSAPWSGGDKIDGSYLALKVKLTKEETTIYPDSKHSDTDGFGWIAIPVFNTLTNIEAGNRYIINISFTNDGAGQIPPGDDVDPGKPVLGKPIFFTVTCGGWDEITPNPNATLPIGGNESGDNTETDSGK